MLTPENKSTAMKILRRAPRMQEYPTAEVIEAASFLVQCGFAKDRLAKRIRRHTEEQQAAILALYPQYPRSLPKPSIVSPEGGAEVSGAFNVRGSSHGRATVELFDGETSLGTVEASSRGIWNKRQVQLEAGEHTLKAVVSVGEVSAESDPVTVTVA